MQIPLFPLGTVLFPQGLLPLRVFEVRYLDMIGRCMKSDAPFGVVSLTQGSEVRRPEAVEEFSDVGTLASIDRVETVQSGLLLVRSIGQRRFRIDRSERLPHGLWTADVEPIDDDGAVPVPPDLQPVSDALGRLIAALRERDEAQQSLPFVEPFHFDDCGWVANRWCELLPLALATRQRLMALDNPLLRLELVGDFLSKSRITPPA